MVYMHTKGKIHKVGCKVTDTPDYPILGREKDKIMGFLGYPQIQPPTSIANPKITHTVSKVKKNSKRSPPEYTQKTEDHME